MQDQKYLESFEMCCWRRREKTSCTKHVKNYIFQRIKEEKNILHTIKWRKANWNGHIFYRNCILKYVIQGKIKGGEDEEEDVSSYWTTLRKWRYCKLKEEAWDSTLWRTHFEGGSRPLAEDTVYPGKPPCSTFSDG